MIVDSAKKPRPTKRIPTDAEKARSHRSIVMALGLVAFVILVFTITMVQMQNGLPANKF